MLVGVALEFNTRSRYEVVLTDYIRDLAGTRCRRAHVTHRPGAFDRAIRMAAVGEVENAIRLQLNHDADLKLCSTISGALKLTATSKALLFSVSSDSRDGRNAIRCARMFGKLTREVSPCFFPLRFEWREPSNPDLPGELIVNEGRLFELSLLEAGAHGGTFARII